MPIHGHPVQLGGKRRTLKLDFNALADLNKACRQELGENWSQALQADGDQQIVLDPYLIRLVLFHGLLHEHPGLSEEQVGEWIQSEVESRGRETAYMELMTGFFKSLEDAGYLPEEMQDALDAMENGGEPGEGKEQTET